MSIYNAASQLVDDVSGAAQQVADLGRTAGERLDEARHGTADALAGAASSVRNTGDAIDDLSKNAAYKLDLTSAYVRNHDIRDMFGGLSHVVLRHPMSVLAGAAAVGFILGTAIRRK